MSELLVNDTSNFYVTGGTLPGNAVSYVTRHADEILYASLRRHEYCYILTSRQMGKSSLMVRTAARLKETGVQTAVVDLTSLGQNLRVDQWYKGILNRIGQSLNIESELDEYWYSNTALPPLERWLTAIQRVILRIQDDIVLFIDEIDMVRSLPFLTDEFFAGIRACYNRREETPDFARLTFCLLGVASPTDLIQDSHITPFNIGKRIELFDFTAEEAAMLAVGITVTGRDGERMMARIFYWTGGQPYLTQRLCAAVADDVSAATHADVDRLCRHLFFSRGARQTESNLAFVSNRILKSGQDVAALLDLYRRIQSRARRVEYDPVEPLTDVLRLSGIVRVEKGRLVLRNRIYKQVFDRAWVASVIPDDLRRQRRAYRAGLIRAGTVSAAIVFALSVFGWTRFHTYTRLGVNNFKVTDIGPAGANVDSMWLNDTGKAVIAYDGSPTWLLDTESKRIRVLSEELHQLAIDNSGIVAGLDISIKYKDDDKGGHPIVWLSILGGQGPITPILHYEAGHGAVWMNSKGQILFFNTPRGATGRNCHWCVYDLGQRKIIAALPGDMENPQMNDRGEVYGEMPPFAPIGRIVNGVVHKVPYRRGSLMGVTNGGDVLTQDDGSKTCELGGGGFGDEEIAEFTCYVSGEYGHNKNINNNGYILGGFNGAPLVWSAKTKTRYNMSLTDGWRVHSLGSINDKNQILALGSKSNGPMHLLLIQIKEDGE